MTNSFANPDRTEFPIPQSGGTNASQLPQNCWDHPFVSIVLCTVGNRPSLERCLDSLVAQGCQRSEILLVLNGPFDPAFPQRVASYPVRLLHEPRRGVSIARNTALGQARGEILAIVDDDIVAHPHWLHELVKGFQDPVVACVTGRVLTPGHPGDRMQRMYVCEQAETPWYLDPGPRSCQDILSSVIGLGCNMAFRKNFLENCAKFPEDLGAGSVIGLYDEPYLFLQVVKHGFRIYYTPLARVTHFLSEEDLAHPKSWLRPRLAGTAAFWVKLIVEEEGCRWTAFKFSVAASGRALRACFHRENPSQFPGILSPIEKLSAFLGGPKVYLQSLRSRKLR